MASAGSLNVTVGLQLAKLEADFRTMQSKFKDSQNSIKRETERSATDIGNEFTKILSRKFSSGEVFKGLLQGFGIGSAAAITDKLINLAVDELQKPAKEVEKATETAAKALDELQAAQKRAQQAAFNRLTPEEQQKELLNQIRVQQVAVENAQRSIKKNQEELNEGSGLGSEKGIVGYYYYEKEMQKNILEGKTQERKALTEILDLQIQLLEVTKKIDEKRKDKQAQDKKTQEEIIKNEEEMADKEIELKRKLKDLAEEERQKAQDDLDERARKEEQILLKKTASTAAEIRSRFGTKDSRDSFLSSGLDVLGKGATTATVDRQATAIERLIHTMERLIMTGGMGVSE
jgi:hypothetical protein